MSKVIHICYASLHCGTPPRLPSTSATGYRNSAAAPNDRERNPEPELTAEMEPTLSPMRWMVFAFLVSLAALLAAAAGLALHIRRDRGRRRERELEAGTVEEP